MANIATSDITVTILNNDLAGGPAMKRRVVATLAFGDGALTYPAGGVPIDKAKLGCPNDIESLVVFDKGTSGYEWSYDRTNEKLVAMQNAAHAHDLLIKGGQAAAGTAAAAHYATDIFGKEAATDATIAGSASATKGGVMASTALAGSQPSAVAIAAQTLKIEVRGW
jgi:hypothetical protein